MNKSQTGLAGEYYVLAQLTHRNFIATLTLSTTKSVDILVTDHDLKGLYKVEVKTTDQPPRHEKLFGEEKFWIWAMSKKHEEIIDDKLFYCFVALEGVKKLPRFFIVPSAEVATYVREQHRLWLSTRKQPVKETSMRKFRIPISDPNGYEGNWGRFRNID